MNRYALTLPLVILSVLLGYFGSNLKMIHVYAIATAAPVFVATSGYLLFIKHQKGGDSKRTRRTKVTTAFSVAILFSTLIGVQLVNLAEANFYPTSRGVKPPDANTEPPSVLIFSPQDGEKYDLNSISLTFNVSLGQSTSASVMWIEEIYFKGDWQENKTYINLDEYYNGTPYTSYYSLLPSKFSFNLTNIPEGKHSITVYANETGHEWDDSQDGLPFSLYWTFFINGSATVNFTIDTTPKLLILSSTFPMEYGYAIVAATVIVAVTVGYLSLRILRQRPNKMPP